MAICVWFNKGENSLGGKPSDAPCEWTRGLTTLQSSDSSTIAYERESFERRERGITKGANTAEFHVALWLTNESNEKWTSKSTKLLA